MMGSLIFITLFLTAWPGIRAELICNMETFSPTCPPGHVVLVTSARYGRMEVGRCLDREYFVGCKDDVTQVLQQRCSGLSECHVTLPDQDILQKQQNCPSDIVSHLEAHFKCVPVNHFPNSTCRNNKLPIDITSGGGFLSGNHPVVTSSQKGYPHYPGKCDIVLRAPKGQTINLTLYEFYNAQNNKPLSENSYECPMFATIKEYYDDRFKENIICGNGQNRQALAYASKTNEISVELSNAPLSPDGRGSRFLMQYQATGCRDPEVQPDMIIHRQENKLDVKCNFTSQVWHLVCKEDNWFGSFGNCTAGFNSQEENGGRGSRHFGIQNGIVMAIIVGVVLGVMIGFCLLIVVYNIRRKRRKQAKSRTNTAPRSMALTGKSYEGNYGVNDPMLPIPHPDVTLDKGCHVICDVTGTMLPRGRERDHVYEKPQPGMEVQCLLGPGQTHHRMPTEEDMLTMKMLENGDYACQLHGGSKWPLAPPPEKFEMLPPSRCSLPS